MVVSSINHRIYFILLFYLHTYIRVYSKLAFIVLEILTMAGGDLQNTFGDSPRQAYTHTHTSSVAYKIYTLAKIAKLLLAESCVRKMLVLKAEVPTQIRCEIVLE